MTATEFKNMDWNDSHVGYDMQVGNYRRIAYLTLSRQYPDCLCLVTDNKDFPILNSGCGISHNPCPGDILKLLEKHPDINRIITIIDGIPYDLKPGIFYVNGIDSEIMFDEVPYREIQYNENTIDEEKEEIE